MKIVCPLCGATVAIGAFDVDGDGIAVSCSACGGGFRVASDGTATAGEAAAAAEPGPGEMRCPKCYEVQPRAEACRVCGLRTELHDDYAAGDRADAPPALVARWAALESAWDDDDAHDAFIEAAAAADALSFAAHRYRAAGSARPGDTRTRARLERITRMAEASLLASAAARAGTDQGKGKEPYRSVIVLLMGLVFLIAVGGVYLVFKGRDAAPEPTVAPPTPSRVPGMRGPAPGTPVRPASP